MAGVLENGDKNSAVLGLSPISRILVFFSINWDVFGTKMNIDAKLKGTLLYVRVYHNNREALINTNLKIRREFWDKKRRRVKRSYQSYHHCNSILESIISNARKIVIELQSSGIEPTPYRIKDIHLGRSCIKHSFWKFFNQYLQEISNIKRKSTIANYNKLCH
ncbi:MAG: hypothetical protein IH948_01925 [Bacteroidetes bacterium]|nr:hypothetical protein [Bacteroidota bacterium]